MKSTIERMLRDLYRIDPSLRGREDELKKAVEEFFKARPEARMDARFERELKEKLLSSFSERKRAGGGLRFVLARPAFRMGIGAFAACLLVVALFQFKPWASSAAKEGAQIGLPSPIGAVALVESEQQKAGAPAAPTKAKTAVSANSLSRLAYKDPYALAGRASSEQRKDAKAPIAAADEEESIAPSAPAEAAAKKESFAADRTAPLANRFNNDFNTEGYDRIAENSFAKTLEEPLSTFSIDVDTASYANVRRFIEGGSLPPPDAVRIEELVNYFSYDYADPKGDTPFGFDTELAACPWNAGHLLLRVGLQAKRIADKEIPPSNLVFLVDVSGSMDEDNKLPLVKESLKILVKKMRQEDKIAIAVYAGSAGLVLPPTPGNRKEKILAAIDALDAGGSTAGGEGILLAYETAKKAFIAKGNNRVVLATDGDFNVGASSDGELVRLIEDKRKEGVFLTVLGFGMGNYKDSKMQKLADAGNGNYAYVDSLSEAEKVLSKQMAGTLYTVAKDVKVQVEFNPTVVGEYRLIGYEKRALAARDFADDSKDAGELGAGGSVTALYELAPSSGASARGDLKYQTTALSPKATATDELMTIKFRYKLPDGEQSKLVEEPVKLAKRELKATSDDYRFAAAVAEWGLILRDSAYRGSANYSQVESLASDARGRDSEGYRAEFLRLARLSAGLGSEKR